MFAFRYNGMLGDYSVNNHEITVRMMRKFLMNKELARFRFPKIASKELESLFAEGETRGTISTIGNDINCHARLALAETFGGIDYCIDVSENGPIQCNGCATYYLGDDDYERFKSQYTIIFPSRTYLLDQMAMKSSSVVYEHESFQADQPRQVNCNIVRARWLKADHSMQIDAAERFARAGAVKRIITTQHTSEGVKGSVVWLEVDWFSMHDTPYALGHHVQIFHKSVVAPGVYSFLPIQRVLSKCALRVCKYQHINVYLTIPLPGHWAL